MTVGAKADVATSLGAALLVLCVGCGVERESKKWREESQRWREQAEAFKKEASDLKRQWEQFGKQMVEAADSVDPLVLKEMFRQNSELRESVVALEKLLDDRSAGGILYLATENLELRLVQHKGEFVYRVWIGTEGEEPNEVARQHVVTSVPPFTFSFEKGHDREFWFQQVDRQTLVERLDDYYAEKVPNAIGEYMKANAYVAPEVGNATWSLRDQLRRGGYHEIHVEVEPQSETWDATFELFKIGPNSDRSRLKTVRMNPVVLGRDLSAKMKLWVKYPEEKT